ncbi:MAG TPA: kelch repeat-containing protein, partial [Thermoplasmata archaeon]|nr:kelch repeat-containing protein [Thermoplasmata archaeon]
MPTSRGQPAGAVIGKKLYVIGGYHKTPDPSDLGTVLNVTEALDLGTQAWTTGASMPTARRGSAGLAVGSTIRVMGGSNGPALIDLIEAYHPFMDSWTKLNPLPRREEAVMAAWIDNGVYVWMDTQEELWLQVAGAGPWYQMSSPPKVTNHAVLVEDESTLYLSGYNNFPLPGGPVLFSYDATQDAWQEKAPPSLIRCNHGGVVLHGLVVVLSGETCAGQEAF